MDFLFLDSGTGGLPYLEYLKSKVPSVSCVYIADNKNFPYGTKSHQEIVECALGVLSENVLKYNPKAIIVACNTISVNALDEIRGAFPDIPVVGTVPAIKLAAKVTKNKRIGLLATLATVSSSYIKNLQKEFASDCEIILREDTDLISFIEKESFTASECECEKACEPMKKFFEEKNCDTVILGCTHFLNLSSIIQKVLGEKVKVVDSRDGVVNRALSVVKIDDITAKENPPVKLIITGNSSDPEYVRILSRGNYTL